jgi:hypothetical protein
VRSKEKAFAHFDLSSNTLNKEAHDAVTGRRIPNIGREPKGCTGSGSDNRSSGGMLDRNGVQWERILKS